jgi:hypothetical protein
VQPTTSTRPTESEELMDMSFWVPFHTASLGPTGAHWLDDPPDVSCKEGTRQYAMDGTLLSCNP